MTSYEGLLERDLLNANNTHGALGLRGLDVMDKVQAHDEETQGSGSGSGFSDFSAMENETDDLGRRILQHQRDQKRMDNAVRGGQQAFRKARPNMRIAERVEREEQERDRQANQHHQRTSSGGSSQSDPPVTVPKEWGRRARKQTDWLKKITAPSENGEDESNKADDDAIYPRRTTYSGDVDWRAISDEPLPSIENTPPSMRRHRYEGTPSSLRHMNTTLKPLADSEEEQDFTAASFLASTPAARRYPRKIDELARKEIEELEQQAVTTRALDEIDQRAPNATLRRTSSSVLRERAIADGMRSSQMSPVQGFDKSPSPSKIPVRRPNGVSNKENVPINGHANAGGKEAETADLVNRSARAVNIKKVQRPTHERQDSLGLLKRLARVSSLSPSPARDKDDADAAWSRRQSEPEINARDSVAQNGAIDQVALPPANTEKPESQGNDGDYVHVEPNHVAQDVDATPIPQDQVPDAKTPVVTGAWVDTMLNTDASTATTANDSTYKAKADIDDNLKHIKSEPSNPKSALAAIVREAKNEPDTPQFGESTIQSLEEIVHPDVDPTDPTITFDFDTANNVPDENLDDGRPLTQAEKDRRQDLLAFEGLNKRLRSARTNIKDASRGLRRVENKIENAHEEPVTLQPIVVRPNKPGHHGHTYCDACGGAYGSVWKALWIELRSCFYTWDPSSKYHIRFTWLGLACLLWWTWFLSESTLCSYYCHPRYAYRMEGYGVDPDAPEFPFVIPTLIFRPLRWFWKPVCEALAWCLGVLFHAFFGDNSTSSDTPPVAARPVSGETIRRAYASTVGAGSGWAESATAAGARVVQSVVDAVDEVGSMWDDEFLS